MLRCLRRRQSPPTSQTVSTAIGSFVQDTKCGNDPNLDAKMGGASPDLLDAIQENDVIRLTETVQRLVSTDNVVPDPAFVTSTIGKIRGMSPLHVATKRGQAALVRALLDHGANINQLTPEGWTPLHYAAYYNHLSCAEILINAGARLDIQIRQSKHKGKTMLHLAAARGHVEMVERLLFPEGWGKGWSLEELANHKDSSAMMDLVGVALANNNHSGCGGRENNIVRMLSQRQTAATTIQRWWKVAIKQHIARRTHPAVVIQAAFRGYRTRKWFARVWERHQTCTQQYQMVEDLKALCRRDDNIAAVKAYVDAHTDAIRQIANTVQGADSSVAASADVSPVQEATTPPPPKPAAPARGEYHTNFFIKKQAKPLAVRVRPCITAPVVGFIHGEATGNVLVQAYRPQLKTTTTVPAGDGTDMNIDWLRIANPHNKMYGRREAWVQMRANTRTEEIYFLERKENVDYTCMSMNTWVNAGLSIVNFTKDNDTCAHYFGTKALTCFFCEKPRFGLETQPTPPTRDRSSGGVSMFADFAALEATSMVPPPAAWLPELLEAAYFGPTADTHTPKLPRRPNREILAFLLEQKVASPTEPLARPNSTSALAPSVSLVHVAAMDNDVSVLAIVQTHCAGELWDELMRDPATSQTPLPAGESEVQASELDSLHIMHAPVNAYTNRLPINDGLLSSDRRTRWTGGQSVDDYLRKMVEGSLRTRPVCAIHPIVLACLEDCPDTALHLLNTYADGLCDIRTAAHAAPIRRLLAGTVRAAALHVQNMHAVLVRVGDTFDIRVEELTMHSELDQCHTPLASAVQSMLYRNLSPSEVLQNVDFMVSKLGCDINVGDNHGITPIMVAAGCTTYMPSQDSTSPSPLAEVVVGLFKRGADTLLGDKHRRSLWNHAAAAGNADVMRALFGAAQRTIAAAIGNGDVHPVLEQGARVYGMLMPDTQNAPTPFHSAIEESPYRQNVVQFLLPFAPALLAQHPTRVAELVDALLDIGGNAVLDAAALVHTLAPGCVRALHGIALQHNQLFGLNTTTAADTHVRVAHLPLWNTLMQLNRRVAEQLDGPAMQGCRSSDIEHARSHVNDVWAQALSPAVLAILRVEAHVNEFKATDGILFGLPWQLADHARAYLKVLEDVCGALPATVAKVLGTTLNACVLTERCLAVLRPTLGVSGTDEEQFHPPKDEPQMWATVASVVCRIKAHEADTCPCMMGGNICVSDTEHAAEATGPMLHLDADTHISTSDTDNDTPNNNANTHNHPEPSGGESPSSGSSTGASEQAIAYILRFIDVDAVVEKQSSTNANTRTNACKFVATCVPERARCCGICMAPMDEPVRVCLETGGEHFKKGSCRHEYCKPCVTQWVKSNVETGSRTVRCPDPDCKCSMHADDIERTAGKDMRTRFVSLLSTTYTERLQSFKDEAFSAWVAAHTRTCPSCHVIIERRSGCNAMLCTCGHRFNWTQAQVVSR
eukprot:m.1141937 g.1141937  ORF g.1141937 m.1141937 type:complete len:1462 (-) comp24452_c0_seq8:844-5229(-)